jgi:uncharacterized protein (TIGR02246 family)
MADSNATIEARLRRLEDLEEIRQLFVDYGHYLDFGDVEGYASLFAREGELMLGPVGRAKGPEAILELAKKMQAGMGGRSYHLVANPIINLDGDRATSDVMWAVIVPDDDGKARLSMSGRHKDELIREDGRWRFLKRRGYVDVPSVYPK